MYETERVSHLQGSEVGLEASSVASDGRDVDCQLVDARRRLIQPSLRVLTRSLRLHDHIHVDKTCATTTKERKSHVLCIFKKKRQKRNKTYVRFQRPTGNSIQVTTVAIGNSSGRAGELETELLNSEFTVLIIQRSCKLISKTEDKTFANE